MKRKPYGVFLLRLFAPLQIDVHARNINIRVVLPDQPDSSFAHGAQADYSYFHRIHLFLLN
jgi:hypothetical protein